METTTMWDILYAFYQGAVTIYAVVSTILESIFSIWFVGPILRYVFQAGVTIAIIWVLYRYMPKGLWDVLRKIWAFIWRRVKPYMGWLIRGIRRLLVRIMADDDMLKSGDAQPQIIYTDKVVYRDRPMKTPFRKRAVSWILTFTSGMVFGAMLTFAYVYGYLGPWAYAIVTGVGTLIGWAYGLLV